MPIIDLVSNGGGSGLTGGASVLRVARVMRVLRTARMARLVRLMPELMILIKGPHAMTIYYCSFARHDGGISLSVRAFGIEPWRFI